MKRSVGVGICPVCEAEVPLEPAPRWRGVPTQVKRHQGSQGRPCAGEGLRTLSRARAWGWPVWEQMSVRDRQTALVHVMTCTNPRTPVARLGHPEHRYQGAGLRQLDAQMVCVHAWDQTNGWDAAVDRWGVEQVREYVSGRIPTSPEQVLSYYGWGRECEAYVEDDRVVGVLAHAGSVRPEGWVWRAPSTHVPVAVPDGRKALGRTVRRHLQVVEAVPRVRVGHGVADAHLGEVVRRQVGLWRPVDVETPSGDWVTVMPVQAAGR